MFSCIQLVIETYFKESDEKKSNIRLANIGFFILFAIEIGVKVLGIVKLYTIKYILLRAFFSEKPLFLKAREISSTL